MPVITSKGQVTIPKHVRSRFGLKPGTEVEFAIIDERVVLLKKPKEKLLDRWVGALDIPGGVDSFVDDMRGKA